MRNSYSQEFKNASISLLLNIIQNIDPKDSKKYYKFLEKELDIHIDEFKTTKISTESDSMLENQIDIIREELEYKRHQIMKFLMIINRCIIIDGCNFESYRRFEKIRDGFLAKI